MSARFWKINVAIELYNTSHLKVVSNEYLGPAVYMLYMCVLPVWVWVGSHVMTLMYSLFF